MPAVRRLVLMRENLRQGPPFSPDGPYLGRIDLVRTGRVSRRPSCRACCPDQPVRVGDHWTARRRIHDLDGFRAHRKRARSSAISDTTTARPRRLPACRFSRHGSRRHEDGSLQTAAGTRPLRDLESNQPRLHLYLNGRPSVLDKDARDGRVDGRFVLSRNRRAQAIGLATTASRAFALEPTRQHSLLYDNSDLASAFLYHAALAVRGFKAPITLDGADGRGLLADGWSPPRATPTGAQFLASRATVFARGRRLSFSRRPVTQILDTSLESISPGGGRCWAEGTHGLLRHRGHGVATMAARCCRRTGGAERNGTHLRSLTITKKIGRRTRIASASVEDGRIWFDGTEGTIPRCAEETSHHVVVRRFGAQACLPN